jgi:hypothetical protein
MGIGWFIRPAEENPAMTILRIISQMTGLCLHWHSRQLSALSRALAVRNNPGGVICTPTPTPENKNNLQRMRPDFVVVPVRNRGLITHHQCYSFTFSTSCSEI